MTPLHVPPFFVTDPPSCSPHGGKAIYSFSFLLLPPWGKAGLGVLCPGEVPIAIGSVWCLEIILKMNIK